MPLGVVVTGANANDGCQTEDVLHALVVQPPVAESPVPSFKILLAKSKIRAGDQ
jgi:hypothetical protein